MMDDGRLLALLVVAGLAVTGVVRGSAGVVRRRGTGAETAEAPGRQGVVRWSRFEVGDLLHWSVTGTSVLLVAPSRVWTGNDIFHARKEELRPTYVRGSPTHLELQDSFREWKAEEGISQVEIRDWPLLR